MSIHKMVKLVLFSVHASEEIRQKTNRSSPKSHSSLENKRVAKLSEKLLS